jgi:FkbM family methyltransferase
MFFKRKPKIEHHYDAEKHCATVDGIRLYLDINDALRLSQKPYEPVQTEWVKQHVKKHDYAIDVGANIGYYTTLLAKLVGEEGRVFAFEPEIKNYKMLCRNIATNDFNNVYAYPVAVGRKAGTITLYKSKPEFGGANGMHRVYPSMFCGDEKMEVDMIALDDEVDRDIAFVKIDAEGAELDILYGMKKILEQDHVCMFLEYGPACVREKGDDPYQTIDILKGYGFKFNREINGKIQPVKDLDDYVDDLNDCKLTDTNIKVANFLLEK